MKVTPSPAWAKVLPQSARGKRDRREKPPDPVRNHSSAIAPKISHDPKPAPITASAERPVETAKTSSMTAPKTMKTSSSRP